MLLQPLFEQPQHWPWALGVLFGTLMSAAYVFRVVAHGFDRARPNPPSIHPDRLAQWLALLPAAGLGLALISEPLLLWLSDDELARPAAARHRTLPGLVIFALREDQQRLRVTLNLLGVTLKLLLVGGMLYGVSQGSEYRFSVPLLPGAPLVLQADALSLLFVALSRCSGRRPPSTPSATWKTRFALLRLFQPVRQRHRGPGAGGQPWSAFCCSTSC